MHELLKVAVNMEWVSRYGGEPTDDETQLVNRVRQLGADRDCWLANAKAVQKELNRLEPERTAPAGR